MLNDVLGREIKIGDTIVKAIRDGNSASTRIYKVLSFVESKELFNVWNRTLRIYEPKKIIKMKVKNHENKNLTIDGDNVITMRETYELKCEI